MVTFLHTADWQLGMTRHYFDPETQGRFAQDRIDVVTRIAELASARDCAFVVIAGDVFETNQPDRRTVERAMEALSAFAMPVYLLPGNHDAFEPASVYRGAAFTGACPANVEVLDDMRPRVPVDRVEVVGATWTSKRPVREIVTDACTADRTGDGVVRVVVGHGGMDTISGDFSQPGTIRLVDLEDAVARADVDYVALGDRHSTSPVGDTGRIWYAGAPEPTSYRETDAGNALVVSIDPSDRGAAPQVEPVRVGRWSYHERDWSVDRSTDLGPLFAELDAIADKARAVVKIRIEGIISLAQAAALDAGIAARSEVFGALEHPERHRDVTVVPDGDDLAGLGLTGYAATARDRLLDQAAHDPAATDALALLVRLAGERDT